MKHVTRILTTTVLAALVSLAATSCSSLTGGSQGSEIQSAATRVGSAVVTSLLVSQLGNASSATTKTEATKAAVAVLSAELAKIKPTGGSAFEQTVLNAALAAANAGLQAKAEGGSNESAAIAAQAAALASLQTNLVAASASP